MIVDLETRRLDAVRQVRIEAERLRLACVAMAGGKALLHLAFEAGADPELPTYFTGLLNRIR